MIARHHCTCISSIFRMVAALQECRHIQGVSCARIHRLFSTVASPQIPGWSGPGSTVSSTSRPESCMCLQTLGSVTPLLLNLQAAQHLMLSKMRWQVTDKVVERKKWVRQACSSASLRFLPAQTPAAPALPVSSLLDRHLCKVGKSIFVCDLAHYCT